MYIADELRRRIWRNEVCVVMPGSKKIAQGHLPSELNWIEFKPLPKATYAVKVDMSCPVSLPTDSELGFWAMRGCIYNEATSNPTSVKFVYDFTEEFLWVETLSMLKLKGDVEAVVVGFEDEITGRPKENRGNRTIIAMALPLKKGRYFRKPGEELYVELSQIEAVSSSPVDRLHGQPGILDGFVASYQLFGEVGVSTITKLVKYKEQGFEESLAVCKAAAEQRIQVRCAVGRPGRR